MKLKKKLGWGQSLTDYSLILGIITLTSIAAINFLGSNISIEIDDAVSSGVTPPQSSLFSNSKALVSSVSLANLPGRELNINLASGHSFSFNYIDLAVAADTGGGNGVTESAALSLENLAKTLLEKGELSPETFQSISQLAHQGHALAGLQKQIEEQLPKEGFKNAEERYNYLKSHFIEINGKSVSLLKALSNLSMVNNRTKYAYFYSTQDRFVPVGSKGLNQVGFAFGFKDYGASRQHYKQVLQTNPSGTANYNFNSPLHSFMKQLQAVEKTGVMKDPALKTLIKDVLSKQIFDSVNTSLWAFNRKELGDKYRETRTGSNDICTVGQGITCHQEV